MTDILTGFTISRRRLLPLLAAVLTGCATVPAGAQTSAAAKPDAAPTVIILVRHGEKAPAPANDPVLDSTGMCRAEMLLDVVRDAKISAVYTTPFARTRL